jgi:hypothetical protein
MGVSITREMYSISLALNRVCCDEGGAVHVLPHPSHADHAATVKVGWNPRAADDVVFPLAWLTCTYR